MDQDMDIDEVRKSAIARLKTATEKHDREEDWEPGQAVRQKHQYCSEGEKEQEKDESNLQHGGEQQVRKKLRRSAAANSNNTRSGGGGGGGGQRQPATPKPRHAKKGRDDGEYEDTEEEGLDSDVDHQSQTTMMFPSSAMTSQDTSGGINTKDGSPRVRSDHQQQMQRSLNPFARTFTPSGKNTKNSGADASSRLRGTSLSSASSVGSWTGDEEFFPSIKKKSRFS
ncbi:unnamed protein product [Discula destructiva]